MILFVIVTLVCGAVIVGGTALLRSGVLTAGAVVLWLALTLFFGWLSFGTEETITVRFEDKERIAEGDGGKWMLYAEGGETFENTDAWYHGKSDSTNLYRAIKLRTDYRCEVNGVRFTVLSMYRNVLSCEAA